LEEAQDKKERHEIKKENTAWRSVTVRRGENGMGK
jgi:hypothetical protein